MGLTGFLLGLFSSLGMVYCSSSIKSIVGTSRAGLAIGTGQMFIYALLIVIQWGSGLIINLFPGAKPGEYINNGFLICFGLVALLIWGAMLLILSVSGFRSIEDAKR
jgi:hypothetical protein